MNTNDFYGRPLSELLPIARKRLITAEHPKQEWNERDEFTCVAAQFCAKRGEMTEHEYRTLRDAIQGEIARQCDEIGTHRCTCLASYIEVRDGELYITTKPHWFPVRDKWLDDLQARFERIERESWRD